MHSGPFLHVRQLVMLHVVHVPLGVVVSVTRPDEQAVHTRPFVQVRQLARLLQEVHVVGMAAGKAYPEIQLKQLARLQVRHGEPYIVKQSATQRPLVVLRV